MRYINLNETKMLFSRYGSCRHEPFSKFKCFYETLAHIKRWIICSVGSWGHEPKPRRNIFCRFPDMISSLLFFRKIGILRMITNDGKRILREEKNDYCWLVLGDTNQDHGDTNQDHDANQNRYGSCHHGPFLCHGLWRNKPKPQGREIFY